MDKAIETIKIGKRFRKDFGDLAELAKSMKEQGLLHPIVIDKASTLIAGERRLRAAKLLGWGRVPVRQIDTKDLLKAERDENTIRKDLTPSEMVAIGREMEKKLSEESNCYERETVVSQDFKPKIDAQWTRNRIGKALGVSGGHYNRAKAIVLAAEGDQKKYGPLVEEMDKKKQVHAVYDKFRKLRGPLKRGARRNSDAPYEPISNRQQQIAKKAQQRLTGGISSIYGVCRGLAELDLGIALSLMQQEERKIWSSKCVEIARTVRQLSRSITERK